MKACCSYKPADRPSFTIVAKHLEVILEESTAAEENAADIDSQRATV
jgi:hypothetical protein